MQVTNLISEVSVPIEHDATPRPQRLQAIAACSLSLAAAPTFAIMAILTGVHGDGMAGLLCSARHGASPLSGMLAMYVLMCAFHLPPWLRLLCGAGIQGKSRLRRPRGNA